MRKKFLAIIATLAMVVTMIPAMAFAEVADTDLAKIGDTGYATLQLAVDAAKDGDTIVLLKDIEYTQATAFENSGWYDGVKYTGDQSFTIDLNGKTISDNDELNDYLLYFKNDGSKENEITLVNGTISGGANLWAVVCVGAKTAAYPTVLNFGEGLTVIGDGSGNAGEDVVAKCRYGSVINVLNGASVISNNALYGIAGGEKYDDETAVLNIYDGAKIEMNCTGGSIAVAGTANVNIYGGTITSEGWGVYTFTTGTPEFTISGGTITGKVGAVASAADVNTDPDAAPVVKISGGTFNGIVDAYKWGDAENSEEPELIITGGIYSEDSGAEDFVAPGYELGDDGTITCKHEETELVSKDATCTEDGYKNAEKCTNCEEIINEGEVVETTGHTYVDGVCVCGDEKVEDSSAITDGEEPTDETDVDKDTESDNAVKTGDESDMTIAFMFAGLAVAAMAAVIFTRKRFN